MRFLEVVCRALLAAVFVVAVANKVFGRAAWPGFVQSLRELRQLPDAAVRPAATATVTVEVLVAVLLLVPVRAVGALGFALAACLLGAFSVVIGLAMARGNRTPCRCFGVSSTPLGWPHLVRNGTLVCVAVLGLAAMTTEGVVEPPYVLLAGVTGVVLGTLVTAAEDIVSLFRPLR
ncbi:MauE/DoxX family redox-associated membrane protein [Plantactinospora sp. WMMB782]|uniref:MauE/DoxX family redox-associated membrane protein n=1 Tax=Plantactinospora sp. WMMB782 TaxID=3404121 RepID=UPI003B964D8D